MSRNVLKEKKRSKFVYPVERIQAPADGYLTSGFMYQLAEWLERTKIELIITE